MVDYTLRGTSDLSYNFDHDYIQEKIPVDILIHGNISPKEKNNSIEKQVFDALIELFCLFIISTERILMNYVLQTRQHRSKTEAMLPLKSKFTIIEEHSLIFYLIPHCYYRTK